MIRTMLGVVIAAAVLTGCASKTQNTTPTAATAAHEAQPGSAASPSAAARPSASQSSGSLAIPAATVVATSAAADLSTGAAAPTAPTADNPSNIQPPTQPPASSTGNAPTSAATSNSGQTTTRSASDQAVPASAPSAAAGNSGPSKADTSAVPSAAQAPAGDLPAGYGLGGLQGYQTNEMAVNGYDDPTAVKDQMARTGRAGGYIEQITSPDSSNGAGASVEVWRDAAGAKAYFDNFPRPAAGLDYQQIAVPGLGEQVFAYKYQLNGQTGYSIAWRRGRIIMGIGELVGSASGGLEHVLSLARLLDTKAQATAQ